MNGPALTLYALVFLAASVAVGMYTSSRRGQAAGILSALAVALFQAFGLIGWAIWYGFTERRQGA